MKAVASTRGFTLTELLAVIAILGVVAALVAPGLSRAKSNAQRAVCMSNLRQVNTSVRMYADDFGDAMPPPRPNRPDFTAYVTLVSSYTGTSVAPVFVCPADKFYYDIPTMARAYRVARPLHEQPGMHSTSYAFNAGNFPYAASQSHWPGIAGWKSSFVAEPSKTLLIVEFPALIPYSWHRPANKPGHNNNSACTVSFVDGHASYIKMYWDEANAKGDHLESWQYDPPPEYGYKWSGR